MSDFKESQICWEWICRHEMILKQLELEKQQYEEKLKEIEDFIIIYKEKLQKEKEKYEIAKRKERENACI